MTKQEHIKEMVSIMAASNNPFIDVPIEIMPKVAEALYNAGYRKLSKDSVVLSREEYERITKELVTEQRATEIAKEYFENIRNETAEKIITFLDDNCDCDSAYLVEQAKAYVAKQFGLEVDKNDQK